MNWLNNLKSQHGLGSLDPLIMAIVNVTPDSFSDGGQCFDGQPKLSAIISKAATMLAGGAHILDIGGESTRPGAAEVSEQEELARVIPVIAALKSEFNCLISVDTSRASVMAAAVDAGANIINDVRSLSQPNAMAVAIAAEVPVCFMHMRGSPKVMQHQPQYSVSVVAEVKQYLQQRVDSFIAQGGHSEHVIIDPGFGFGKTLDHNVELFKALDQFLGMNFPVLVGVSRKTMIGDITGRNVDKRLIGSVSAALLAAQRGCHIIRVHDVLETVDALAIAKCLGLGNE